MKHFTGLRDLGPKGLGEVLSLARAWKTHGAPAQGLAGKILGMVFFNPSLRTRTSFEAAMMRSGGGAISLEVGAGVWTLEHRDGVVMDENRTEHVREAVPVLARYVDALGVRTFAQGQSDAEDHADVIMNAFRELSTVPVISMESAREHPCQGLADMLTVHEVFGDTRGVEVALTWAPHVKALPKAVPNSFLLSAAAAGCKVRVAHPEGFELDAEIVREARSYAAQSGGTVDFTRDQSAAVSGARVLYAKAWGPATASAPPAAELPKALRQEAWMPTTSHLNRMAKDGIFMHCLPTRRNLEVADSVLDDPRCRVVDEAENRLHVQRVLLHKLLAPAA